MKQNAMSHTSRAPRILSLALVTLFAACCFALTGCNGEGGVAATVNGEPIYEAEISSYIQENRTSTGYLDDDAQWADYLTLLGMTPRELRETTIMYFAQHMITEQVAAENGISVSNAEVDADVNAAKKEVAGTTSNDDKAWVTLLVQYGYTPDSYRDTTEYILLYNKLCMQMFNGDPEAANAYLEEVFDKADIVINDMPTSVPYNVVG